jgi:hypothetical protein
MFFQLLQDNQALLDGQKGGRFLLHQVSTYTSSFRETLDASIDKRLVRTFFDLFVVILMFRNRAMGLVLSELGGYICGPSHAPAGTKRISNLLRSSKWSAKLIDQFFFTQSKARISSLLEAGKRPLVLWDDSRIEKAESWVLAGLCSVWSSKAKRLTRIRRGFYNPPRGRVCVPGFKWTGVFLSHLGGVPSVCHMRWWTTRGKFKEDPDNIIYCLLRKIHQEISQPLVHVLDRGYASEKMLRYLFKFEQDFIIRWKKNHLLTHHQKGQKKTHLLARSFKGQTGRIVEDNRRKNRKYITLAWAPVQHPQFPDKQLYLIIARDKKNYNSPLYILTSIEITNAKIAWEILFSYFHRWEAEQGFRFLKSEMAIESPRLWFWENRLKLFAIVTMVYDFILKTLRNWTMWISLFLKNWAHRTGKRYRDASIPLYRLRLAISNCLIYLWAINSG